MTENGALKDAHAQKASANSCVPVSHLDTVELNGVIMTPVEAFHQSPSVKVSAP